MQFHAIQFHAIWSNLRQFLPISAIFLGWGMQFLNFFQIFMTQFEAIWRIFFCWFLQNVAKFARICWIFFCFFPKFRKFAQIWPNFAEQAPFGTASQSSAARVRGSVEMLRTCEVHSSKPSSNETLCQRAGRLTDENMWQFWFVVNVGYFWLTAWQFAVIIAAKFGQFGAIWSNFGQFWAISCNPISCNLGQFLPISTNFYQFQQFFGFRHAIF